MNLLIAIYLISCWILITLGGITYLYIQAIRVPEKVIAGNILPRLDLLNRIVYLSIGLEYWKNEAYQTAYDDCIKQIGRVMANYPEADWDVWWLLTYQVLDVYQYQNR